MEYVIPFLRKVPLRLALLLYGASFVLMWLASLIGLGGRFYAGDFVLLLAILLNFSMMGVVLCGYVYPAFMRFGRQLLNQLLID